jgi:YHS domain-containing protein
MRQGQMEKVVTVDPVCGMDVMSRGRAGWHSERPALSMEYEGTVYCFCGEACRREFERDPEKYVHREAGSGEAGSAT